MNGLIQRGAVGNPEAIEHVRKPAERGTPIAEDALRVEAIAREKEALQDEATNEGYESDFEARAAFALCPNAGAIEQFLRDHVEHAIHLASIVPDGSIEGRYFDKERQGGRAVGGTRKRAGQEHLLDGQYRHGWLQ